MDDNCYVNTISLLIKKRRTTIVTMKILNDL